MTDEEQRAIEYQEQLKRGERAMRARRAAFAGDRTAAQRVWDAWRPRLGRRRGAC